MFVVTVRFRVAPGRAGEFLPAMQENARLSLSQEPGCLRFDVCVSPEDGDEVFLYEVYTDEAAFAVHKTMAHYLSFSRKVEPLVMEKSVRTHKLLAEEKP